MNGQNPHTRLVAARDSRGDCPFASFLGSETDVRFRASVLNKVEHLTHVDPADYDRPLIDTLDGRIKELRFGKSLRVLFSVEDDGSILLLYGGERKKQSACSPELIEEAKALRTAWLQGIEGEVVDVASVRDGINRKRLGWPE